MDSWGKAWKRFLIAFTLWFAGVLHAQQETAATLSGLAVDENHLPIVAARVVVEHGPTAGRYETKTNGKGLFALMALPVGGPYQLTIEAEGFETQKITDLLLELGENRQVELVLETVRERQAIRLEKVEVRAERVPLSAGLATTLSREAIENVPSIEDSLNEYASRDPRVVYVDPDWGELAAVGQNSRYNSISVDGVRINDQFGLSATGFPSQGNPLSLETLEAISVDVSPYDVNYGGFTGATMNAVTRSGTNQFHGSVYARYRDDRLRAPDPVTGQNDPFRDETLGATFGGPFWRDHLFYFTGYEYERRTEPAPGAGFTPTIDALNRIAGASASYGYDPGVLVSPGKQHKQDNKYLGKIDWRISPRQRLSLHFNETLGNQPCFADYETSGRVSLSGHWYNSEQNFQACSAQWFSQWSPDFQTDAKIAWHRYTSERTPYTRFPQVRIYGVPGVDGATGSVLIGTEESSQVNELSVNTWQAGASGTWLLGRHRLLFGAEVESSEFENTFLQNAWGSYTFSSISAYEAGKPSSFTYQYMLPGRTPAVAWGYRVNSCYLQDNWMVTPRFTLAVGVRLDYSAATVRPHYNPLVEQTFGRRNDNTLDGVYAFGPRASFSLKLGDKNRTHLRGGAGVFQGRTPGVWLSNAYSNDGMSSAVNTVVSGFSPDPDHQPQGIPALARQQVDLIDDRLHLPTVARGSLAFEHLFPWHRLVFTAEYVYTRTLEGLDYKNINLRCTGTGPDGRAIYGDRNKSYGLVSNSQYASASFADVYLLTNTSKGEARHATFKLERPLGKHWGASLSYTRGFATDVSSVTSSTAATNYEARASIDPNDDRLGTTNYEIRDRVLADLTWRFALVKRFDTKVTLHYEGRSGRPYSYVFGTDVNGDGSSYDNDLFYVPTGRDDSKVRWASVSQADAFFAYLETNPSLKRFAGSIVPRNSERSEYQHRYDLKFTQELPWCHEMKAELFFDILNVANLLNDKWGRVSAVGFPYGLAVANASYDPKANQYVYRFTGAETQALQPTLSRWQMQVGARVKF